MIYIRLVFVIHDSLEVSKYKEVCNLLNSEDEYQVMFFLVNFRIPRRKRSGVWYFQKEEIVDKNQESHKRFNISM